MMSIEGPLTFGTIGVWFFAAFFGGLALNLTPCVFPMIPVTMAFFSAQSSGRLRHILWLGLVYVIGMSLTYAALGSIVAATGALFGSALQHPLVLSAVAVMIVGLALSMFGLYELRPPSWFLQRFGQASTGAIGALVMGLSVGIIAAPCIGPFVVSLLLFVGQLGRPLIGFALLFVMGLGMGLPYVVLGVTARRISQWPKAGAWLVWTKQALGVVLVGLALYFVRPVLAPLLVRWLTVAVLMGGGVYLGWMSSAHLKGRANWIRWIVGLAMIVAGLATIPALPSSAPKPTIAWEPFTSAKLAQAKAQGRPALVDLYADWCVPCVELDHVTFHHPSVVAALASAGVVALRIDATRDIPPEAEALVEHYQIIGVPTILLFDAQGRERPELRVTGFIEPAQLVDLLRHLESSSSG